jgi:hypothetical protein
MFNFFKVDENLNIKTYYSKNTNEKNDETDILIPEDFDPNTARISLSDTGEIVFSSNVESEQMIYHNNMMVIRHKRNELIRETDWRIFPDVQITDDEREKWNIYRQSLRDLPQTITSYKDLKSLSWPIPPS